MRYPETKFPAAALKKAKPIKVFLMDVDGTLTPGYVCLQTFPDGSVSEMKMFNAHDGAGIKLAHIMGIRTGVITGRDSPAVTAPRQRILDGICVSGPAEKTRILLEGARRRRRHR